MQPQSVMPPAVTPTSMQTRDSAESAGSGLTTARNYVLGNAGTRGRAAYRFLNRTAGVAPKPASGLALRRLNESEVLNDFLDGRDVFRCCGNDCCLKLLGSDPDCDFNLPTDEMIRQRRNFVSAVLATRKDIHSNGQIESGRRLLARLRLGVTESFQAPDFAQNYTFPGQRLVGTQEFWWRLEDGGCLQVEHELSLRCAVKLVFQESRFN